MFIFTSPPSASSPQPNRGEQCSQFRGADPIGVLAHLQLGRTFALAGDRAKAKLAYEDFLTRWKDADSDVPILVSAD